VHHHGGTPLDVTRTVVERGVFQSLGKADIRTAPFPLKQNLIMSW
jgi:hypothetical protein